MCLVQPIIPCETICKFGKVASSVPTLCGATIIIVESTGIKLEVLTIMKFAANRTDVYIDYRYLAA